MRANLILVFILSLLPALSLGGKVTYLRPNEPHVQDVETILMLYAHNRVHVFCKEATPPSMWNLFQSTRLRLKISADADYKQYKAASIKEIYRAHHHIMEHFEGKPLGFQTKKDRIISLSVHNDAYYGIYTSSKFVISLEVISYDLERVAQFIFGLVLWASCRLLADSLLLVYCSAAALGAHLAGVVVVFVAVLASGEEPSLARLCPLKANFKLVYEERPTLVVLMLLGGAWIFQAGARKVCFLWRYQIIRTLHRRLLGAVCYLPILHASDNRGFGRICVCLLFSLPEIWVLLKYLRSKYKQYDTKGGNEVNENQRTRRFHKPRHFSRYPCEDNPGEIIRNYTQDPFVASENSSFNNGHFRRRHRDTIFHPSRRSTPYSERHN